MKRERCPQCGSVVETKVMESHLRRHEKDKERPAVIVTCVCCGVTKTSEHGSSRFCSRKCSRSYSTKDKRQEINEKVSQAALKKRMCDTCGQPFVKIVRAKRRSCPVCHEKNAPTRRAAMLAKLATSSRINALRRIDAGERWFGTQTSYNFRGQLVECDSYLEKACLMMIDAEWPEAVSVARCSFWIPYGMPGEVGSPRRYNPDFLVILPERKVIVEVKTVRMGKADTWEDYREKALVKQRVLEEYVRDNGYDLFWCTQRDVKPYYRKVLADPDRPRKKAACRKTMSCTSIKLGSAL
jgi:hypothetical protein